MKIVKGIIVSVGVLAITYIMTVYTGQSDHVYRNTASLATSGSEESWKLGADINHSASLPTITNSSDHVYRTTASLAISGSEKESSKLRADINHSASLPTFTNISPIVQLSQEDISGVEKFVFFVGYPRSSHSVIGSLMDAHPNMIVAHECNIFVKWRRMHLNNRQRLYTVLYNNSYRNAYTSRGWRSSRRVHKGYTLDVSGGWQGRFTKLKVIGDKSGGQASKRYKNSPAMFVDAYHQLQKTVGVPVRAIHVVRNPYDMISTEVLYWRSNFNRPHLIKLNATEEHKYSNIKSLAFHIDRTLALMKSAQTMIRDCNLTVLEIHNVDFVHNPRDTMQRVCDFLDLECSEDYLQLSSNKAYTSVSRTRLLVEWPNNQRKRVFAEMHKYPSFKQYTFEGD